MTHNKTTAAIEKNVQAEENLQSSANKTASAEQKVADSLNKSEQEAKEYGDAMIKAADDSEKLETRAVTLFLNWNQLLQVQE